MLYSFMQYSEYEITEIVYLYSLLIIMENQLCSGLENHGRYWSLDFLQALVCPSYLSSTWPHNCVCPS